MSLRQLLLRAGDVEMNPGPKYRSIGPLQERELLSLAHDVSPHYYNTLCIALGFTHARSKTILTKNLADVCASVFEILCMWKTEQTDGTDCRRALSEVLRGEDLNLLANKISKGIYKRLTEQYTLSPTTVEIPTKENREQDSDNLLKEVAKKVHTDVDIYSLGVELGFEHSEVQRYMQANRKDNTVTFMGTLNMLHVWRNRTKRSEEHTKLKKALIVIGHLRLADDLLNDDMATDTSLECTVPPSPRPSPSTSVAIPFQDGAAAGEVSTARASGTASDGKLNFLADRVPDNEYYRLSDRLGIGYNKASTILSKHNGNFQKAMRECFSIWKNMTGGSFIKLKRILNSVHLGGIIGTSLGDTISTSSRPFLSTSVAFPFQDAAGAAPAFSTAREVSDAMLNHLARNIPSYAYTTLSEKLGIKYTQARNIVVKYNMDYEEATRECLEIWRDRSTRSVADLHDVLREAELGDLIVHL